MRSLASGFVAAILVAGCALPSPRISPTGRSATVHTRTERVHGELIAVSPDTLWVLTRPGGVITPLSAQSIARLDVKRHAMGGTRTMQIMAVMGATTGTLLTAACSQVDDTSCGTVLPGALLTYLALGALFGVVNSQSAWMKYTPAQFMLAQPYTRFPQGLPDTVRLSPRAP